MRRITGTIKIIIFTVQYALIFSGTANAQSQPEIFAEGVISTGDYESHPAFSPSGDTLLFLKSAPDFGTWTICMSLRVNGQWTQPTVAPFSGRYTDADPFFSRDGKTVLFSSNRPLRDGDTIRDNMDIWQIGIGPRGWGTPIHLDSPVNSSKNEWYPTLADDGTLYFGSERTGGFGGSDLYRCAWSGGKYGPAINLGPRINTADEEYEPFIAPDQRYLIFMAARPASSRGDIYVSYNRNGQWTEAEKIPWPISSDRTEYSPKVSRDGKTFYFSSTRRRNPGNNGIQEDMQSLYQRIRSAGNGLGDIYQVDLAALHLKL